jgi:very-short-patch-repair endonuclease
VGPKHNPRRLRRQQTGEEKQLWRALRAGRFAGFKFRRQHDVGNYFLDFYCALARLSVELDGFQHGLPEQILHDREREQWLMGQGIKELRFWNRQWRENPEGVLLEIWHCLPSRTGCKSIERKQENRRFYPPQPEQITKPPLSPALSPLVPRRAGEKQRPSAGWHAAILCASRLVNDSPIQLALMRFYQRSLTGGNTPWHRAGLLCFPTAMSEQQFFPSQPSALPPSLPLNPHRARIQTHWTYGTAQAIKIHHKQIWMAAAGRALKSPAPWSASGMQGYTPL